MDQELIATVRKSLEAKPTDELRQNWAGGDRSVWSPEAFEAMRQILTERGVPGFGPVTVHSPPTSGELGDTLLTFAQIVSVLGCLGCVAYLIMGLTSVVSGNNQAWMAIVGGLLGFLYSAAMLVVFSRVKRIPPA